LLDDDVFTAASAIVASLERGGRLMTFGNGGSAADALHVLCDLVERSSVA
jgi:phosphoheptose isomerase